MLKSFTLKTKIERFDPKEVIGFPLISRGALKHEGEYTFREDASESV